MLISRVMSPPKNVEQYQGVSLSDEVDESSKKGVEGFKKKKRKKYAGFLPPYFPQVMAVVTGKVVFAFQSFWETQNTL